MVSPEFADRPLKKLVLFDVDGTLSLARQVRMIFVQDVGLFLCVPTGCFTRNVQAFARAAQEDRHWIRRRI